MDSDLWQLLKKKKTYGAKHNPGGWGKLVICDREYRNMGPLQIIVTHCKVLQMIVKDSKDVL